MAVTGAVAAEVTGAEVAIGVEAVIGVVEVTGRAAAAIGTVDTGAVGAGVTASTAGIPTMAAITRIMTTIITMITTIRIIRPATTAAGIARASVQVIDTSGRGAQIVRMSRRLNCRPQEHLEVT